MRRTRHSLRRLERSFGSEDWSAPIPLGDRSNAEYFHQATRSERLAQERWRDVAEGGARLHGLGRREFLTSSMGMATALAAVNWATGCSSEPESPLEPFDAGKDPLDPDAVEEMLLDASEFFIFDVQTHHVERHEFEPPGTCGPACRADFLTGLPGYTSICRNAGLSTGECFGQDEYIRQLFLESDTSVAVLGSGWPSPDDSRSLISNHEVLATRDRVNVLASGTQRVLSYHLVIPNRLGVDGVREQLDQMDQAAAQGVAAWKTYSGWGPGNTDTSAEGGFFLDDEVFGLPMIERGLQVGVPIFCMHKGLPSLGFNIEFNSPIDVGRVAKLFPDAKFVVYHSGYAGGPEGAYEEGSRSGANALITSLLENDITPNSNVYAELGSAWQFARSSGGHFLGKLLQYVGENNVLWGTDSIWYGSAQNQIEPFLQFQISELLRDRYGYPELTRELKAKILGLNAAALFGVDPDAIRLNIEESTGMRLKRELDSEFGARRWAVRQPLMQTRQQFWAAARRRGFAPG